MVNVIEIIGKTNSDGIRLNEIRRIGNTNNFVVNVKNIHSGREEWLSCDESMRFLSSIMKEVKCRDCCC